MFLKVSLFIVICGILYKLLVVPDIAIPHFKLKLGEGGYDIKNLEAPVATGTSLKLFANLLTSTVGPIFRRHLLNTNGLHVLRELSALIDEPFSYYPMYRVKDEEYQESKSLSALNPLSDIISKDPNINLGGKSKITNTDNYNTVRDYADAYRSGKTTPSQSMERTLAAIREFEKQGLNIFTSINVEEVIKSAALSTERFQNDKQISIFDGVPIVFKDMMEVKGHYICSGRKDTVEDFENREQEEVQNKANDFYGIEVPKKHIKSDTCTLEKQDDAMVKRFRDAGAIILGVTIMTEGGVTPLGWNVHYQGPFSAYSTSRYSGGSSSGSAIAVATNLVPVAIGYDGGGSIRIPASMSGIHGFGTGWGRVPFNKNSISSMIKTGPMTHTSEDAAMVYSLISQNLKGSFYNVLYDGDNQGPPMSHIDGFHNTQDLKDVRIGVFPEWFEDGDEDIVKHCYMALKEFTDRGATIVNITIPHLHIMSLSHGVKISTEFATDWDYKYHENPESMEDNTRITIALAKSFTSLEVDSAMKIRGYALNYFHNDLFKKHNLTAIASPTGSNYFIFI
jgi:Asp-tRNA(Asn)/Glu-tRNA(Gln) amidotransferase A subunit family amidase